MYLLHIDELIHNINWEFKKVISKKKKIILNMLYSPSRFLTYKLFESVFFICIHIFKSMSEKLYMMNEQVYGM